MPLRPIVSTVGSANCKIAKRLNTILAPYARQADSHVTDTRDFVEKIDSVTIEDKVMVSYDVISLFTSGTVDEVYAEIILHTSHFIYFNRIAEKQIDTYRACVPDRS